MIDADTALYRSDAYARDAAARVLGHTEEGGIIVDTALFYPTGCLLYTSPSPRDLSTSRMPSSA